MTDNRPERWITSRAPDCGINYAVTLWFTDAVPDDVLQPWREETTALREAIRQLSGSGEAKQLQTLADRLNTLNTNFVRNVLLLHARADGILVRGGDLRRALQEDDGVLGYEPGEAGLQVLLRLNDERGVEEHIASWRAAAAFDNTECILQAFTEREANEWLNRHPATEEPTEAEAAEPCTAPFHHITVLGREATDALQPAEGKVMIDATLGGGGHSELLLQAGATVWGIDCDPSARAAARRRLATYGERMHILAGHFGDIKELMHRNGVKKVDGIVADLGISSPQVDTPQRGFSFLADGPLDMRMDPATPRSAADIVNHAAEDEIADILRKYGEERAARAIARRIVQQRETTPITSTKQLADLICTVLPRRGRQHPATRSFQALRIAVNDELAQLQSLLQNALPLLSRGGRFAVITFHSLEDRAVKHFFEHVSKPELDRPEWPMPRPNPDYTGRIITRKPITPGQEELSNNPRSRSAKLRVLEKI